ncbi:cutinase family protein, partial [Knoellia sp. CPCC 206391]
TASTATFTAKATDTKAATATKALTLPVTPPDSCGSTYVAVRHVTGTISTNTTWSPACAGVYLIDGSVTVAAGASLTVSPTSVVKVSSGGRLSVSGTLIANGTATSTAAFTSIKDDTVGGDTTAVSSPTRAPAAGDWNGIDASTTAAVVSLSRVRVRYASTAVDVTYGALTLTDSTLDNSHTGVFANRVADSPTIQRNTFATIANTEIRLWSTQVTLAKLEGNTATGSTGAPILDMSSVTLATSGALPFTSSNLTLVNTSSFTVPAGTTLTLNPGAVLKSSGTGLIVGGTLTAAGTATNPVVFTSIWDSTAGGDTTAVSSPTRAPAAGDWNGIDASTTAAVVSLSRVRVRYASTAVDVTYGALTLTDSTLDNSHTGVFANRVADSPTIQRNTFATIANTEIRLWSTQVTLAKLEGNTATGSTGAPILDMSSVTLATSGALPFTSSNLTLVNTSSFTVPAGTTLTLNPGAVLKSSGTGLIVGGTLTAAGTATNPVVFTSIWDSTAGGDTTAVSSPTRAPATGDWNGIDASTRSVAQLDFIDVRYASTALRTEVDVVAHIHGSITSSSVGVSASGSVDATNVQWGNDGPPGWNGNPTVSGEAVTYYPWTGVPPLPPMGAQPPPQPVRVAGVCTDYLLLGMRGSGESGYGGLGPKVNDIYQGLKTQWVNNDSVPSTATFSALGIPYEANPVPIVGTPGASAWENLKNVANYTPGAWDGAVKLIRQIQDAIDTCGSTGQKIVLAGYSQGSWVIHAALGYVAVASPNMLTHISAVALLADPLRSQNVGLRNEGTADPGVGMSATYVGFAALTLNQWIQDAALAGFPTVPNVQMGDFSYPASVTSRTVELCDKGDAVCDTSSFLSFPKVLDINYYFSQGSATHSNYSTTTLKSLGADLRRVLSP